MRESRRLAKMKQQLALQKTRKKYVNVININVDIVFGEFEGGRVI